ncbi:GNAT family N-acetyltransferase [Nocardiopsis sp. L17-MgMaSL7]|uniref:GNAT family N-acetyltransferase n=1 Tax=Nocardiopsis sp. L17-MgMaSL7 TaxID=1938893 RepID=UPI000D71835C|nr:GNAT family N-acetyltransferase [Nocardiopsis sp. L17-MgMaSL7]PWV44600.1 acetyltransferase (GNAT) family protein [Nocardiopsis sp. L17-MgMaSL7]
MAKQKKRSAPAPSITPSKLAQGWAAPVGGRIRPARPDDLPRAAELLADVGTDITQDLNIAAGDANTSVLLHECLTHRNKESAMRAVAGGTLDGRQIDPMAGLSALLVATDRAGQVIGCALMIPPGRFLAQVRRVNEVQGLALMLVITKLKGLAVDPAYRGQGIGAALVKRSVQLYAQSGFHVMYGQFTADRDLEPFYRRQHFTVLDLGEPLRLETMLALPASIASEGKERFFHRLLG